MELIIWPCLGMIIGLLAAQAKGFSPVAGGAGGALLGPLAVLMFFVTGVTPSDAAQKKCPYCAELVKAEAIVCKHCGKDIGKERADAAS
jgi:hypothetical protein